MDALAAERIELFVQPVASPSKGTFTGLDTLVHVPECGGAAAQATAPAPVGVRAMGSPSGCDEAAEVVALNSWRVDQASRVVARWWSELHPSHGPQFVSISLDKRFVAEDDFLAVVKEAVRSAGIDPEILLLSVDAGPGLDLLWVKLQRLKSHGVRVALENFSIDTHATDLLRRFAFDTIRIPGCELRGASDEDVSSLRGTIRHAHNLGCEVLVEGVDDQKSMELASWLGADLVMGAAIGDPRSAEMGLGLATAGTAGTSVHRSAG